MLMKSEPNYTEHDQNWHWPEKTWFRERLNAVKAEEHEQRRKAMTSVKKAEHEPSTASTDNHELKID
jgi:hypothetical protein